MSEQDLPLPGIVGQLVSVLGQEVQERLVQDLILQPRQQPAVHGDPEEDRPDALGDGRRVLASVGAKTAIILLEDQFPVSDHEDRVEVLKLTGIRSGAESLQRRRIQTCLRRSDGHPISGPGIRT